MRTRLAATFLMLFCVGDLSRAEKPSRADLNCQLEIVEEYPPNAYLYFCDYFSPDCGTYQGVNYYFGSLSPVPYENCPDDCGHRARPIDNAMTFGGREKRVPLDYMHEPPAPRPAPPVPPGTPGPFKGMGVNKEFDAYFVKFFRGEKEVYAKVIELRVKPRPRDANLRGLSTGPVHSGWRSIFVAFETESNPADAGYTVYPVIRPQVSQTSEHVWTGRITLDVGKSAPVLILLAKEGP